VPKKKTFYVGDCYVDSGRIWIGDPAYITDGTHYENGTPNAEEIGYKEDDAERSHPPALDGAPHVLALEPLGKGMGLIFPSGQGDGIYPVYIRLGDDGRVEAAYITFTND
jgi:hypothetical protein